jgi:hypothetical protein
MITIEDCIALSDLTEDEIDAIAEHEHLPEIIAAELGWHLVGTPGGERTIRGMLEDNIATAVIAGKEHRAALLKFALGHYLQEHQAARSMA